MEIKNLILPLVFSLIVLAVFAAPMIIKKTNNESEINENFDGIVNDTVPTITPGDVQIKKESKLSFEFIFAIAGLFAVAFLVLRQRK